MHPAEFAKLSPVERESWAYSGAVDIDPDWRVVRVAELTGLDVNALEWEVEAERGWESHDVGYLHAVLETARTLLAAA